MKDLVFERIRMENSLDADYQPFSQENEDIIVADIFCATLCTVVTWLRWGKPGPAEETAEEIGYCTIGLLY